MIRCSECKHCGVVIIQNPYYNRSFYSCGIAPKEVYWNKVPKGHRRWCPKYKEAKNVNKNLGV